MFSLLLQLPYSRNRTITRLSALLLIKLPVHSNCGILCVGLKVVVRQCFFTTKTFLVLVHLRKTKHLLDSVKMA